MKLKIIKHLFVHTWKPWVLKMQDGEIAWFVRRCRVCDAPQSKYVNIKTGKRMI